MRRAAFVGVALAGILALPISAHGQDDPIGPSLPTISVTANAPDVVSSPADAAATPSLTDAFEPVGDPTASGLPTLDIRASDSRSGCSHDPRYDDAFAAFGDGDAERALRILGDLRFDCPGVASVVELEGRIRTYLRRPDRVARGAGGESSRSGPGARETPDTSARVELIVGQSLLGAVNGLWAYGYGAGYNVGAIGFALSAIGSMSAFGLTAFGISTLGVRTGQALTVNSAGVWGGYTAAMIAVAASGSSIGSGERVGVAASLPVGTALGVGLGTAIAVTLSPRAGQIATVNSFAFWSGAMAFSLGLGVPALSSSGYSYYRFDTFATSQAVGIPFGLIVGTIAAVVRPMSRVRMLVVDGGAALGGGVGGLIALLAVGAVGSGYCPACGFAAGSIIALHMALGFGITLALTAGMDRAPAASRPAVQSALLPFAPDGRPGFTAALMF